MKTALVTGGARGIGKAIAMRLALDGFKVCVGYCNSRSAAEQVATEIGGYAVYGDVSSSESAEAMVYAAEQKLGRIDVLVNNAGAAAFGLLTDMTDTEWRHIMGVNLDGVFYCTRAALPAMVSCKRGKIINISSVWGQVGASCEVAYSAAKAGVIGMTRALAKEVGLSGIQVNCVAPGACQTDMTSNLSAADIAAIREETPLARMGKPEDIAGAVAFLASEEADFITGQVFTVDGGWTL